MQNSHMNGSHSEFAALSAASPLTTSSKRPRCVNAGKHQAESFDNKHVDYAASNFAESLSLELHKTCLEQLGVPYMLFEMATERLAYANRAARSKLPTIAFPTSFDSIHKSMNALPTAAEVFDRWALDTLDFGTARFARDKQRHMLRDLHLQSRERRHKHHPSSRVQCNDTTSPSLEKSESSGGLALDPDGETEAGHRTSESDEDFVAKPYLLLRHGAQDAAWWQAQVSLLTPPRHEGDPRASNEHYYVVLLLFAVKAPVVTQLVPPEAVTDTSELTRPALIRKTTDPPPQVPDNIDGLVSELVEAQGPGLSPEFYKSAIECMPQIMFTSAKDGTISYLNPQWYAYTGWDADQPDPKLWLDIFHASDVEQAVVQYGAAVREGRDIQLQYRVKSKEGVYRWMLARGRCIRDASGSIEGFVCTLTDGEDLIKARHEALEARLYISTVLQSSNIALVAVDRQGKVTMLDGYVDLLRSLGVTKEKSLGKPFAEVWPDKGCVQRVQDKLMSGDARTMASEELLASFGDSHFRYRITSLYSMECRTDDRGSPTIGELTGLAVVCTDVTAMISAVKALQKSQAEREALLASENAAKEASRLKTVFVTSLSHEIRTPISGMLGISELLLAESTLSDKQRDLVTKQLRAGEFLLQLVSMVLDIGKMEVNKLELEVQPFRVRDLLHNLDHFTSIAEAKRLFMCFDVNVDQDIYVQGDKLRMAQVLSNFISNSIKFTSQGGITLHIKQVVREADVLLQCEVIDTGIGIAAETVPSLFQPFHQANVSISRVYGGSGLGLSISKSLIELMRGTVTLTSQPGKGTSVRIEVPFLKAQDPFSASERNSRRSDSTPVLKPREKSSIRLLIAEDNGLLQEVYSALLKRMGFTNVSVAADGQQALDMIDKEPSFDICLMDCEMPVMSGPEAVAIIRKDPRPEVRGMRIIALTANAVSGDEERLLAAGMDKYLPKPVRANVLEQTIMACLAE